VSAAGNTADTADAARAAHTATIRAAGTADGTAAPAPVVRVVSGNPTAEELAVVVAVLSAVTAAAGAGTGAETGPVSQWTSRERAVRVAPRPSRDGWRASAFPPAL
jgi:hypothetical protein